MLRSGTGASPKLTNAEASQHGDKQAQRRKLLPILLFCKEQLRCQVTACLRKDDHHAHCSSHKCLWKEPLFFFSAKLLISRNNLTTHKEKKNVLCPSVRAKSTRHERLLTPHPQTYSTPPWGLISEPSLFSLCPQQRGMTMVGSLLNSER